MKEHGVHIDAVAFDFGGVLVDYITEFSLCQMASAVGASTKTFEEGYWLHRHDYDIGQIDAATYWSLVLKTCERDALVSRTMIRLLLQLDAIAWSTIKMSMMRWAHALREEGYRIFIISNMAVETYEMVIKGQPWAEYFEYVLVSGVIGVNKPAPEIFLRAVADLDLTPPRVLFLDDRPDNVTGAEAVGFRALTFSDTAELERGLAKLYSRVPVTGLRCEEYSA